MLVLGLESSCDETAAAVVRWREGSPPEILSDIVLSQWSHHAPFGGVVPEIAARAHVSAMDTVVAEAMGQAGADFGDLSGVAATAGPGLVGGLMVAVTTGKAISLVHGLPFLAVNHLAAHALSARLVEEIAFPFLVLLVSGGHSQLLRVNGPEDFERYGTTIDDAVGEAFDKAAKAMGLGFPGGPAVEAIARRGRADAVALPRPLLDRPGCDFSFSGLKTAVLRHLERLGPSPQASDLADLAASFQATVGEILADRVGTALGRFCRETGQRAPVLVVAGGVAANAVLRERLRALTAARGARLLAPPARLCTDNGAMVAWAGIERLRLGGSDMLSAPVRPRWPLDPERAGTAHVGLAGAKGPKA